MTRKTFIALVVAAAWGLLLPAALLAQASEPEAGRDDGPAAEAKKAEGASGEAEGTDFHVELPKPEELDEPGIVLPRIEDDPAKPEPDGTKPDEPKPEDGEVKIPKIEKPEENPEIDPRVVIERIIEGMDTSAVRLSREKDPGEKTQTVQKKVIEDMTDLIEYVKQQQAQSSSSSQQNQNQQSKEDSSKSRRQQQGRQGRSGSRPQTNRAQNPAQDEVASKGSVQEEELEEISKMLEERWGELLKNAPRETRQAVGDMILEKYRGLLGRYFYALARRSAEQDEEKN